MKPRPPTSFSDFFWRARFVGQAASCLHPSMGPCMPVAWLPGPCLPQACHPIHACEVLLHLPLPWGPSHVPTPGPTGSCYKKGALPEKRRAKLRELAQTLVEFTMSWDVQFSYYRAAQELRKLADGRDHERAPAGFLETQGRARAAPCMATTNPYYNHLPGISWQLLAKFD